MATKRKHHPYFPGLESTLGSATGEAEHSTVAGGWAGTDDDTSTAPSDRIGIPPDTDEIPTDKKLRIVESQAQSEDEAEWDKQVNTDELEELRAKREHSAHTRRADASKYSFPYGPVPPDNN